MRKVLIASLALASCAVAGIASAHQSYRVSGPGPVYVQGVDRDLLYRRMLGGEPQAFAFEPSQPVRLRLRVLVPDAQESKRDVRVALLDKARPETEPLEDLIPDDAAWDARVEDGKTGEAYLVGASVDRELQPGSYELRVWSSNNDSAYALLFGELDAERQETAAHRATGVRNGIVIAGLLLAYALYVLVRERRKRKAKETTPEKETAA